MRADFFLCAFVAVAAVSDLRTGRIPNAVTLSCLGGGLLVAITGLSHLAVADSLSGAAIGCLIFLPGFVLGLTGGGDLKLGLAAGSWLGPEHLFIAYCASVFVALACWGLARLRIAIRRRACLWRMGRNKSPSEPPIAGAAGLAECGGGFQPGDSPAQVVGSHTIPFAPAFASGCLVSLLVS